MRAASARRSTCTIIGSPAISASGFPGSLTDAMRAGMRTITSPADMRRGYTVARSEANRLSLRRRVCGIRPADSAPFRNRK